MFQRFLPAHTRVYSSIDTLSYRKGGIEARIELHADDQAEFEKRVTALKLQLGSAIQSAETEYKKAVRALFIEFGQIIPEPPIPLTNVVPRGEGEFDGSVSHA